jgi:hypothetical protein
MTEDYNLIPLRHYSLAGDFIIVLHLNIYFYLFIDLCLHRTSCNISLMKERTFWLLLLRFMSSEYNNWHNTGTLKNI